MAWLCPGSSLSREWKKVSNLILLCFTEAFPLSEGPETRISKPLEIKLSYSHSLSCSPMVSHVCLSAHPFLSPFSQQSDFSMSMVGDAKLVPRVPFHSVTDQDEWWPWYTADYAPVRTL